jgi:hypothetical protein
MSDIHTYLISGHSYVHYYFEILGFVRPLADLAI